MSNLAVQREHEAERSVSKKQRAEVRIMKGIGASAGVVVGPCRIITRREDLHSVKRGEILVSPTASRYLVPFLGRLQALVTEVGGRLTIAAHHARERAVPHVAGVTDLLSVVTDGQIIRVDGSKGTVSLL